MKTIKKFQEFNSKFEDDYTEVWEVDKNDNLSGFSLWLTDDEINELAENDIIFYERIDKYAEPLFNEDNREKVEDFVELRRNAKKYNL